ncbi:response regulator [Alsobacter sp. SYSU M60028]|uniref:Response regulator n=1 Tax=Alsobacter ponti TaxID=2962936 RepID=A0ABT1LGI3_9HYPH|nr:response regulator [Alsobacter ponti]MCP8940013.1 response regulator [Alsobacter ponti]
MGASVTVHILEDDPGVSDSLQTYMKGLGHEAVVYRDAESFFGREPPAASDTIIVDLFLPGIGGAKVIGWLMGLKNPPRVIAISGQAQSVIDRQLSGVAGNFDILRKPLSPHTIAQMV